MKYTLGFVIFIFSLIYVWGQSQFVENAQTYIPESIKECYKNHSLRNPENRLPMTIETFVDLVRKVENFQKGTEDVTTLATSMLHRFRLDGIELDTEVKETEGVLPYAVHGKSFFKHRVVLRYLIPSNNLKFPNESLSQVELCTLHFMLSHTIERAQRDDESTVCGKLEKYESSRSSRTPRDIRYRRLIEEEAKNQYSESKKQQPLLIKTVEKNQEHTINDKSISHDSSENHDKTKTTLYATGQEDSTNVTETTVKLHLNDFDHSLNDTLDTETDILNKTTKNQDKTGKFIFDDDIYDEFHRESEKYKSKSAILMPITATTTRPHSIDIPGIRPRVAAVTSQSNCPVEYGVVKTKWGSVSLGTVLAGIAAGLYSQEIPVQKLIFGGKRAQALSDEVSLALIDNKFAATLTGDLSEVALHQGPKGQIKVGTPGGWNNTVYPKWYFDKVNSENEMTDAEIRGGLDGLIMGTHVKIWKSVVSASRGVLKLSQLLDMYYSEDGVFYEKYRACDRKALYPEVAPTTSMQEQAFRFAVVLDQQTLTTATLDEASTQRFSTESVGKLMNYLPRMIDEVCTKITSKSSVTTKSPDLTRMTPYVNITIVIDSHWSYTYIKTLLYNLMQKLNLGEFGSKVTVIDGKNRAPFLVNAIYTTDIETNFTQNSYSTYKTGMDIPKALEQELKTSMQGILTDEDTNNVAGGRSTIILFIPSEAVNLNQVDLEIARDQMRYFRESLPDVTFLYLAPGSKENYKVLVEDITSDVITYTNISKEAEIPALVDQVVERIKKVPIRLSNPNCGSDWSADSYNLAEFTYSVKQFGVNFHRLHANYLYGVETAEIKIESFTRSTLKVCFSRKNQFPDSNSTSDTSVQCQQLSSDSYTYKLSNPCEGFDYISQCPPLYVSVASVSKVQSFGCIDCQYPHNAKYKISNMGLGCMSGVTHFLGNSLLVLSASTFVVMLTNLII